MAAQPDMPAPLAAADAAPVAVVGIQGMNDEQPDWTQLLPELVRKIAEEKLLAIDVTEYINFRGICKPWRDTTTDPSILHPRFFPRNWLMLKPIEESMDDNDDIEFELVDLDMVPLSDEEPPKKKMKPPTEEKMDELPADEAPRRFVNVRTGAMLNIRLPPVEEYGYVLTTAEGLLLLNCQRTNTVRIFNPLTVAMTVLPGLANAPKPADVLLITSAGVVYDNKSPDSPSVMLVVSGLSSVAILHAKPGDEHWGTVDMSVIDDVENVPKAPPPFNRGLSLHGRFFVATRQGDVLQVSLNAPHPHLVYVLRPPNRSRVRCSCGMDVITCHLVPSLDECDDRKDNDGMLLVRCRRTTTADVYGVHLGNGSYTLMMELGNRSIFLPSTTLRADENKFPLLPQAMVHQQYERIEDYIG